MVCKNCVGLYNVYAVCAFHNGGGISYEIIVFKISKIVRNNNNIYLQKRH